MKNDGNNDLIPMTQFALNFIKKFVMVISVWGLVLSPVIIVTHSTPAMAQCGISFAKAPGTLVKFGKKIQKVYEAAKEYGSFIGDTFGGLIPKVSTSLGLSEIMGDIDRIKMEAMQASNEAAVKKAQKRKEDIMEMAQQSQFSDLECETASAHSSLPQADQIQEEIANMGQLRVSRFTRNPPTPAESIRRDFEMLGPLTSKEDEGGPEDEGGTGTGEEMQRQTNNGNLIREDLVKQAKSHFSGLTTPANISSNPFYGVSAPDIPDRFQDEPDAFEEIYDFQCRMVFGGIKNDRATIPASALRANAGREAALRNTVHDIRKMQLWSFCNGYLKKNKSPTVNNGRWLRSILRKNIGLNDDSLSQIADAEETAAGIQPWAFSGINPVKDVIDQLYSNNDIDKKGRDYLYFIQQNYPNTLSQDQFMDGMLNARFKGTGWFTGQISSADSSARTHNQLFAQSLMQQRNTHKLLEFLTQFLMMDVAMDLEGARP